MLSLYAANKTIFWALAICLPLAACTVHYLMFARPARTMHYADGGLVRRFSRLQLALHWIALLLFGFVAYSGIKMIIALDDSGHSGPVHGFSGLALFILGLVFFITIMKDMGFRSYDRAWLANMGGYLGGSPGDLPAGRFNAGQKIYFWLMLLTLAGLFATALIMEDGSHETQAARQSIAWCVHGLLGCLATTMFIGHGYLSLFANPQTARVLLDGKVSRHYTDTHHSRWDGRRGPSRKEATAHGVHKA